MQYGCLAPVEGTELVEREMRSAARYYNALIALERCRRAVYRDLRRRHVPELAPLELQAETLAAELAALRDQIKAVRKEVRGRAQTSALDNEAKRVHGELRTVRESLKAAKLSTRTHPALVAAVAELDARAAAWHKALRATSAPFWGTYLLVEASIDQARKALIDPDFRRARGRERVNASGKGLAEGRIGVQIQGGMSLEELYGGADTRLRIEPVSDWGPWDPSYDGRKPAYARLWMRVGSEGRAPVWAVFPLKMHRAIPVGAIVKGATVQLRVTGTQEHWSVSLTYTREAAAAPVREVSGETLALDLGWRKRPDASLRIAYSVGSDGTHSELLMPPEVRGQLRKARDLREIQDRHFNRAVRWLERWLRVQRNVPAWLEQERRTLGQWRSHARLRALVVHWRSNRFDGDRVIFVALERWLHRSRHLYQWEARAQRNALLRRRDHYRNLAAQIARRYGVVVIEKFDLTRVKRRNAPEQGPDAPQAARAQLHAGAPGELRQAITQTVTREGGLVVELDAAGTTTHCHACGGVCAWDQAEEILHQCEHCGVSWDQDFNAASNLLRIYREQLGDAAPPRVARDVPNRTPRFAKRHQRGNATGE